MSIPLFHSVCEMWSNKATTTPKRHWHWNTQHFGNTHTHSLTHTHKYTLLQHTRTNYSTDTYFHHLPSATDLHKHLKPLLLGQTWHGHLLNLHEAIQLTYHMHKTCPSNELTGMINASCCDQRNDKASSHFPSQRASALKDQDFPKGQASRTLPMPTESALWVCSLGMWCSWCPKSASSPSAQALLVQPPNFQQLSLKSDRPSLSLSPSLSPAPLCLWWASLSPTQAPHPSVAPNQQYTYGGP